MKGTLERRLLVLCFLALLVTVAVNTGFSVESFRQQYRDGVLRRCQTVANSLKSQVEKVLGLGVPLSEIGGLSERCQAITANDPEIAYCLIEDPSGIVLAPDKEKRFDLISARLAGYLSKDISVLDTRDLGRIYDLALPLYDFNDKLAGRVRIGFQDQVLSGLTVNHLARSLLVLGGVSAAVFALMILFIRRDLVTPVRRMCGVASQLAEGEFNVVPPAMEIRELATLGEALSGLASSLKQRDAELRSRYRELESANQELQHSFERLEGLSAELESSREMYRSLLEDASDAILVCDESGSILLINKSAERLFGMPHVRAEGQGFRAFLREIRCVNEKEIGLWYESIRPGHASDAELRFTSLIEQRQLLCWVSGTAIVGKQGKRLVQLIARDATSEEEIRVKLERAARELERLNHMKNSFLGLASHELKTPLTIILGYVELLLNEMSDNLDVATRDMLRHIGRAGDRLSEIVRDMVDVSMLDNRMIELMSQDTDINDLVRLAAERSTEAILQRRQKLRLDLADNLPLVRCDQERMVQALGNVLGNAVKFTPDFGLIRICTRHVLRPRLPEKFAGDNGTAVCAIDRELCSYVEVAVIDSGIGIPHDEQETVFDKFYEVGAVEEHSSGKVAFKSRGAGLGLTIVKGVVGLHGGVVWAESPGYDPEHCPGSTFFILLPTVATAGLETPGA